MKLATLCYIKRDGKTLMLRRAATQASIHTGKWNGLGGKLKSGETPEECVTREVYEESGLTIQSPELRGILTFPAFQDEEDWYVYVFVARDFSGTLTESNEGSLAWIPDTELTKLPLWEGDPIFLKYLHEDRFFSGKFVYQHGKLMEHRIVIYSGGSPGLPKQYPPVVTGHERVATRRGVP